MPNLLDVISKSPRAGTAGPFSIDLDESHLRSTLPPELQMFEDAFRFVPVDDDPFEDPKDRAEREAREAGAKAKKASA